MIVVRLSDNMHSITSNIFDQKDMNARSSHGLHHGRDIVRPEYYRSHTISHRDGPVRSNVHTTKQSPCQHQEQEGERPRGGDRVTGASQYNGRRQDERSFLHVVRDRESATKQPLCIHLRNMNHKVHKSLTNDARLERTVA